MSETYVVAIICDGEEQTCGAIYTGSDGQTSEGARAEAIADGWHHDLASGLDYCPAHAQEQGGPLDEEETGYVERTDARGRIEVEAPDLAEAAAERHLRDRPGTPGFALIYPDGHGAVFEGFKGTHTQTPPTQGVHLVMRDNLDGLYGFVDEGQADAYAARFEGADRGTLRVVDATAGARLLAEEDRAGHDGAEHDGAERAGGRL